jgi:hypothetical protein
MFACVQYRGESNLLGVMVEERGDRLAGRQAGTLWPLSLPSAKYKPMIPRGAPRGRRALDLEMSLLMMNNVYSLLRPYFRRQI